MRKMLASVIVSTALIQGCTTMPDLAQMPDKAKMAEPEQVVRYVSNTQDSLVLTSGGDCLRATGWASENMMVECHASAKPAAVVEEAPKPRQLASLSYDGTALFAFDSAELSSEGRRELGNLVSKLNGNSQVGGVAVVGHADSIGTTDYNQSLSERRAAAVRQYLQTNLDDVKVVTSGMGESAPVADNMTSAGRQRNRRVEVKINAVQSKAVIN